MASGSSVSLKHVLTSEIISVITVMRRNSRWSSSLPFVTFPSQNRDSLVSNIGLRISTPSQNIYNSSDSERVSAEYSLMRGFQDLKRSIRDAQADVSLLPLPTILGPFFSIIRSPLSTGPITSAALASLLSFFVNGLITTRSPSLQEALVALSHTVSHCKFEASDSSGDEVALLRLLGVIEKSLCSELGDVLGDTEVCEMLETALTTCCQMRLSEILRRSAENTLQNVVRAVFSRLAILDPETEEAKLLMTELEQPDALTMSVSNPGSSSAPSTSSQHEAGDTEESSETPDSKPLLPEPIPDPDPGTPTPLSPSPRTPYGLPSIIELVRVLITVLDPMSQQQTDSIRLIALTTLNTAFQTAGTVILKYPSLMALISDQGCKFLFQLARSENINVLAASLRTIATVMETMRPKLKLQQELFLAFTIDRLAPPPLPPGSTPSSTKKGSSKPTAPSFTVLEPPEGDQGTATPTRVLATPARGETRDLVLECLGQICNPSSFMVDLYTNYDCDINCENMFERLIDFLTKAVYPSHYRTGQGIDVQQRNSQYMCLDLLLTFVNDMAARNMSKDDSQAESWPTIYPSPQSLVAKKSQKKLIIKGASLFNTKPSTGIAFLRENRIIDQNPDWDDAESLARFLKSCARLDKRLLGDFVSKPDHISILQAFMQLFDFRGKDIAAAMRELLESFRLPGESQQIERITETFARAYFASDPDEFKNTDAIHIFAFAVIMLNTDQHNPQIRKRMVFEDFQRNLRGTNDGDDFSTPFLQSIFESIKKREIVMPEEHTGQVGFEFAWKELLLRSRSAGDMMISNARDFDMELFQTVWKPVISAIGYAFMTFDDDYTTERAIAGFRQCATLAGVFDLPNVFDFVVMSLSQATSLLDRSSLPSGQIPNYPIVIVEGQDITVSRLSVDFGLNAKGQLAAIVLFNIVNGRGNALREGWTQIFEMFQMLFLHSLLPMRMLQMEDFLGGVSMIPLRGRHQETPPPRTEGGLLSALSSYLMTPYSASDPSVPQATQVDIEHTMCSIDCITSCRLDELYQQILQLNQPSLLAAMKALEALAHERTVLRLKQGPDDVPGIPEDAPFSLPYDPASVFLLEMMTSISIHRPDCIEEIWPIIFNQHISQLLSSAPQYSDLLIERAVVALLRLFPVLASKSSMRDQIYVALDLLAGLPQFVANSVAEPIITGVTQLIQKHRDVIQSSTEWNLVFALIRSTLSGSEASRHAFDLISALSTEGPSHLVTVDNFSGLVTLLDDFASIANVTFEHQISQNRRVDPAQMTNPAIVRGKRAMEILCDLKNFVGPLSMTGSEGDPSQAWRQLWLPLLGSLSRQSASAVKDIRHLSLSTLNRHIMGDYSVIDQLRLDQAIEVFTRVIFPLVSDLLKPEVFARDSKGMPETQLRAESLMTRAFKRFASREKLTPQDVQPIWLTFLEILRDLLVGSGSQLREAVPEDLRGVLLVMNVNQLLAPPSANANEDTRTEAHRTVWKETAERMETFLPGFLAEVIPSPMQELGVSPPDAAGGVEKEGEIQNNTPPS